MMPTWIPRNCTRYITVVPFGMDTVDTPENPAPTVRFNRERVKMLTKRNEEREKRRDIEKDKEEKEE